MRIHRLAWGGVLLLSILSLGWVISCGGGGGGGGGGGTPPPAGKVTVTGRVTGSGGLGDATVSAGGVSTTTDANGFYTLSEVPVPEGGRLVVTFEKSGYATYQRSLPVEAGKSYAASAKLLVYDVNEPAVDPTRDQSLEGKDAGDVTRVKLDLPAGSIAGASGPVSVSMALGDPTTQEGRASFPGDYMAAEAGQDPDTPLESVAFAEITIKDDQGNELEELDEPATLKIRLPDAFQSGGEQAGRYSAGDRIPWWSYDETRAVWVREDADPSTPEIDDALVVEENGVLYSQGKVTHFTWWNADHPVNEHACLCAVVRDENDQPIPGMELVADGVSYNGTSYPALTGDDGKACVNVKRSTDEQNPEKVRLFTRAGNVRFGYDVTDASEGDVDEDILFVPTTQGSTLDGSGTCTDLMNPIAVRFDGVVTGTVTYENSGRPAPGFTLYTDFGPTATTDDEGKYTLEVPVNVEVLLFAPGLASRTVIVTDPATPVIEDFVLPNRAPQIDSLTRSPDTTPVDPGATVTFTASASDPDGDPITYAWSADAGSPSSGSGDTFTWTAPSGATTAHVSLTVTDDKGASDQTGLNVVVGGGAGGTTLRVTVKDNATQNNPFEGAYVILHGSDGKSVERTIQTGSDGVADFGDIGRTRVTLTIAYEEVGTGSTYRWIDTFVDVTPGEIVYYTDTGADSFEESWCTTPEAHINVNVTGAPAGATTAVLQPFSLSPVFLTSGQGSFPNVSVCPGHIQSDGKISMLAMAQQFSDAENSLLGYGFLVDQDLADGSTFDIPLDRTPLTVTWNTDPARAVGSVVVDARRKGVSYTLGYSYLASPASFGNLNLPNEFPVDAYWISAGGGDGTQSWMTRKRYDQLAQTVTIPVAGWSIDAATYDDATGVVSWTVSGDTADLDVVTLDYFGFQAVPGGSVETEWTVALDPGRTEWTRVDLPNPVSTWIESAGEETALVGLVGTSIAAGFDDLWAQFTTGQLDLETDPTELLTLERQISMGGAGRAAARKTDATQPRAGAPHALRSLIRK